MFTKGYNLYIRYNDFGEYSYQLQFSSKKHDRIRYDNFDDKWLVTTKPNHFHRRGEVKGVLSPMKGFPEHNIPILIKNDLKPVIKQ